MSDIGWKTCHMAGVICHFKIKIHVPICKCIGFTSMGYAILKFVIRQLQGIF